MENLYIELVLIQEKLYLADYLLQINCIYKSLTNFQTVAAEEKAL